MLEELRRQVWAANRALPQRGLVLLTWGNVSGIDRASGLVVIKPSGVEYEELTPKNLVVVDLDGRVVVGTLRASGDAATHLGLYKAFPSVGGIVHTHSTYATAWAQTGQDLPCYGTTHADSFYGPVPCTRLLTASEVETDYEAHTGTVVAETFRTRGLDPTAVPGVLCACHGPFTWGSDPAQAVENAQILEEVARMALLTRQIAPDAAPAPDYLVEKHYRRKHGPHAYYGQG